MKSFRDYLKEDVVPTAVVKDGSIDLEREVVRAQINSSLASVLADPSVTPYNALVRASKVLSYFSIILPKRVYLDGEKGIEAIELRQFGDRMGMTDQGEFIKEVPGKFYLFIQYWRTHPNVVPYAATANFIASTGGMFKVAAKVVDKTELDRLIDMAEVSLAESAEDRQAIAKINAPKEGMHTALGDCDCSQGDSPSTKSAVSTSMRKTDKKLASGSLEEAMTRSKKNMAVRRFMSHDPEAGERILKMGKKEREEKKSFASAKKEIKRLKEEQLDEVNVKQIKKDIDSGMSHDAVIGKHANKRTTNTDEIRKVIKQHAWDKRMKKEEEQIDEASVGKLLRYKNEREGDVRSTKISASHSEDMAKDSTLSRRRRKAFGDEAKWLRGKQKKMEDGIKLADAKLKGKALVGASKPKHPYMEETLDEGMPAPVIKHKQQLANMSDKEFAEKHGHKSEKDLRDMAARHGYGWNKATKTGSDHYVKRVAKAKQMDEEKKPKPVNLTPRQQQDKTIPSSVASYAEKIYRARMKQLRAPRTDYSKNVSEDNLDEAMGSIKKTYAMKKMKKKVNTQVKQGLGIGKERTSTVLVTNKGDPAAQGRVGDPSAAGGGGVYRIPREKYDPKKHNLASE